MRGDLAWIGRGDGREFERGEDLKDFVCADDVGHAPSVGVADVHVFDEADVVVGGVEAEGEWEDFLFVEMFSDDDIDFHGSEADGGG